MGQIARLATFAGAAVLVLLSFVLPWLPVGTGRLPGGLARLGAYVALPFCASLVVSGVNVVRGHRSPSVRLWTSLSAIALALTVLGVLATFDGSSRAGLWCSLASCGLALVGHSRLLDRFDPPPAQLVIAPPPAPVRFERTKRDEARVVRAADVGHAGMHITTDAGSTRLAWDDILRVQLITGIEPGVELTTRDAIVRINRKSVVDYRFVPGAIDGSDADKLRCLYEYARERNPSLRLTP